MDDHMRPVRGSRIVVAVLKSATAENILAASIKKFAAHETSFDQEQRWFLVYPNGKVVDELPEGGGTFRLDLYREQVLKDFQRITLYIAPQSELHMKLLLNLLCWC